MKKSVSPLETHLGYWMRLVSNQVSHSFSQKLEARGVTVAEWVILRELLRSGETAPSNVAESLGLTRGAVSKLAERLVAKELIDRTSEEDDRRFQRIALTRSGRALVPQLARLADENDDEFFGHLSAKQRVDVMALLRDIAARQQLKKAPLE